MDKVIGGTPRGCGSICGHCRNSHVIVGINMQSETYCTAMSPYVRMRFPVSQCSDFDDKRVPSLYDMEKIAWTVESRNRGKAGFSEGTRTTEIEINPPKRNENQPY